MLSRSNAWGIQLVYIVVETRPSKSSNARTSSEQESYGWRPDITRFWARPSTGEGPTSFAATENAFASIQSRPHSPG